jgi:hypothetical protein
MAEQVPADREDVRSGADGFRPGDHLRVRRWGYFHHGIYLCGVTSRRFLIEDVFRSEEGLASGEHRSGQGRRR